MRKFWVTLALLAPATGPASAQDAAGRVIEKAIKAHGGAEWLDRHQAARVRVKATMHLGGTEVPAQVETLVQLPGQLKTVIQVEIAGKKQTVVQVLNGDKGWMAIDGKTQPLDGGTLAGLKESFYAEQAARLTPLLRDKNYRLSSLPETKADGRPAVGVKVAHAGRPDIYLYFDKAGGLLVKSVRRTKEAGKKDVLQEDIFGDYKEYNGVKRPTKFAISRNGQKFMDGTIVDYMPLDRVDAKEFAKP